MIGPRLWPYVLRTVLRAPARSALTVLGTALALAIFAFVRTLEGGVAGISKAADRPVLVVFQQSRFCPLTSELPLRYRGDLEAMPGVAAVLPTLVYVNQCQSNLDLVTIHGVDPASLEGVQRLRAVEGDMAGWGDVANGALVGKRLAERRNLHVGDRARLGNVDVLVRGIVDGDGPGLDNVAFVRQEQLQLARKLEGQTTQFLVQLKDGADAVALAREIDRRFSTDVAPTDTKSMQAFVEAAVREVAGLVTFARWLGWLAVVVVVVILGNTVFISAQTRAQELGTLETLGLPKGMLARALVTESLLLAIAGGLLGTTAVVVWFRFVPTTLGVEGWGINFDAGLPVLLAGLVASIAVGLAAAVGPVIEIFTRPLSDAVRPT